MDQQANIERRFLGWDRLPLASATEWLIEHFGVDMSAVTIASPAARGGRLLEERLARGFAERSEHFAWRPPTILTAGALSDHLLDLEGPSAGRLTRTLAWAKALSQLDSRALKRLMARPPRAEDPGAWWRLAQEVRSLFGDIAAEGLQFENIANHQQLPDSEGERQRWVALAQAQVAMEAVLAECGEADPHLQRLRAIEAERSKPCGPIVLVGVVEMNELLRRALELSKAPTTALVFAPEELTECFDHMGCLDKGAWSKRSVFFPVEHWRVVDRPSEQAEALVHEIASWEQAYSANQITIGLGNAAVGPFAKRRLSDVNVSARDAAGSPLAATGPMTLLESLGKFLATRSYAAYSELLRHPDFEEALRREQADLEAIGVADDYHNRHLPHVVDGQWLAQTDSKRDQQLKRRAQDVWQACTQLLGPLWEQPAKHLEQAVEQLRAFLESVYASAPLDSRNDEHRGRMQAMGGLAEAFVEIESLPAPLLPAGNARDLIELCQRMLQAEVVPPRAVAPGEDSIEMLGWLDLPLDDAPALVVAGFEDGHIPESVRGDAFLPNSLRRNLGLIDDEARLARDLFATELLGHSRERLAFISGRRSLEGDPLVPSRIVFHCEVEQVAERVKRFLAGSESARVVIEDSASKLELPRGEQKAAPTRMSVTDFRLYLRSPYQYYLTKVLGLKTLDDRAREMDPLAFGNLAHDVLQRFGESAKLRDEQDPIKIQRFLSGELRGLAREIFGERPLPAVLLQIEQLEHRLRIFAHKQAERRQAGWRIVESEWSPPDGHVLFDVDGQAIELHGRIDRIDHHPERKQYAIWDYKTGDNMARPASSHRASDGSWRDLQLPLYCVLAAPLIGEEPPAELGYITIAKKSSEILFAPVKTWGAAKAGASSFEEGLGAGYEAALDVVRAIRREEFFSGEGFDPREEILRAIGGLGLVEAIEGEEDAE